MLDQNDSSAHVAEAQTQYQAAPEVAATEDGQGSPLTASDSKSCPLSSEYSQILRRAARTIFDPESLGNVDELLRKYDCQIKSPSDAIAYADEALKTAGDPYTDLHPREEAEKLERMEKGILKGGLGINMKVEPGTETAHVGPVLISRVVKDGPPPGEACCPETILSPWMARASRTRLSIRPWSCSEARTASR
ncbi:MAG: hypothetical protein IPM23_13050 [Candidatus Melainabacteria bacterium]|nr:hypothetical protein [Candidatus Melainabacteria bacterium]